MPSLPSKLKISCFDYTLQKVPNLEVNGAEAYGSHEFGKLSMLIKDDLPPQVEAACLLHEIMHAVYGTTGLYKTGEQEEAVVEGLSTGLCQVFRDNKELVTYLMSLLNEH